jgi:tape measure domain-containing protein
LTAAFAALGGLAVFKQIGELGIGLDKARNAMTALTGSVDNANKKLAELRKLAQQSPRVTATFATQLFQQLKAVGEIGDQAINKTIKSLGKLNTVFGDVGPDFTRNLVQIFQQGFERADIKEALGRVPIFEQLLEKAFGTKDADKLRKLKEAGKLTLDSFLTGLSSAIDSDARLKNIGESLGGRLQKAFDETKQKLAETGEKILQVLLPALDKLLPTVNSLLDAFSKLPEGLQAATIGIASLSPAISPAIAAVRSLATAFLGLGSAMQASLGLAGLVLVGGGIAFTQLRDLLNNQIPRNVRSQINPQGLIPDTEGRPLALIPGADTTFNFGGKPQLPPSNLLDKLKGAATAARSRREDPTAKAVAKTLEDIRQATDEFGQGLVEDLEQISKALTQANVQGALREREIAGRPAPLAGHSAALAERIRQGDLETLRLEENTREHALKQFRHLQPVFSETERFMQGFASQIETVGDAFENFGANVSRAFGNVRDLFNGLKQAVLGFFNDLVGGALQNLVRSTLAPIFGGLGGGIGNIFRMPPTFPASVSGGVARSIAGAIGGRAARPPGLPIQPALTRAPASGLR